MSVKLILKEFVKSYLQTHTLPKVYEKAKKQAINEKLVILADAHHEALPFSMELVFKYLKEKTGIINVIALEGDPKTDLEGVKYINRESSTVSEFIDLFDNASLVITSSFHGTAFAINMNKPLVSVVPNDGNDSRQSHFLKAVGADNCIVSIGQNLDTINPNYDSEAISNNLDGLRKKNMDWLKIHIC